MRQPHRSARPGPSAALSRPYLTIWLDFINPSRLQISLTRFALDDPLDALRAEAGLFRFAHDPAHLPAQPAGKLALLIGRAVHLLVRMVGAVAHAATRAVGGEGQPALLVVVAGAVSALVAAARLGLLGCVAAAGVPPAVFVPVAGAFGGGPSRVVVASPAAALFRLLCRAATGVPPAVVATAVAHAAGRSSATASLMNDNRYLGQFDSPV